MEKKLTDGYCELNELIESLGGIGNVKVADPELITFYKNYRERRLWIDFEVDGTFLEYARYILRWNIEDAGLPENERQPIYLYMFNYGGEMNIMWMFIDVIKASKTPVYTINMGQCCSAAALIFMSGHKRFMLERASVLIHEGSGEVSGDAVKVMDQAENYKASIKKMRDFILEHTCIPSSSLNRKKHNDWTLDAQTCLKYKVCDKIVESIDEIITY